MKDLKYGILNEIYGSQLSAKQNEILTNYYDYDLSLTEIAENNGITRQAICDALRKGEMALEKLEGEMCIYSKQLELKGNFQCIERLLDDGRTDDAKALIKEIYQQL